MYLVLFSLLVTPFAVNGATLKEAFQAARLNMESIKRADQNIEISEQQKSRAMAGLLPTINGFANETHIDPPETQGLRAFTLTKQFSVGVRLVQPLIRGGVLGALDLAKENILLSKFQKDATELNLYQLVINAYYNLKMSQNDVKNLEKFLALSKDRVSEIRNRAKIGRSRKGELVEAETQFFNAEAEYQQSLILLNQSAKNYEFLTRLKAEEIPELSVIPKAEGSLEFYQSKIKSRPDILATQQQVRATSNQIEIAKGGHYPALDFIGNYYVDRTGILASSEWDAGVILTVPFYQGGGVSASVKEAVAAKRISELNAYETNRAAERDLNILYQNYVDVQVQLASLGKALNKSEEAYTLNKKDYRYGLVTNLDVLQTLNFYIQTKRSFDNLNAFAHMTYKNLEAAIGVLP
jgi:outer membrane protein